MLSSVTQRNHDTVVQQLEVISSIENENHIADEVSTFFFFLIFSVVGIKPRTLNMLEKRKGSTTELHPQS